VLLQLTIRTYKEEVRQRILASIERIAKGVAAAAGIPEDRAPIMKVIESEKRAIAIQRSAALGKTRKRDWQGDWTANVIKSNPLMASEDFGVLNLDHQIPSFYFWLGRDGSGEDRSQRKSGKPLPSLHSSLFEPLPEPTCAPASKL
jgi:hippurate hydrolase